MSEFILERSRITVLNAQRLLSYIWKSIVLCSSDHVFFRLHILHSPGRCLRSSNQKLLLVPRSRLKKKGDQAFAIAGPKLWNSLPVSIRTITTEELFKTRLKAYLRGLSAYEPNYEPVYYFRILFDFVFTIFMYSDSF